MVDSVGVVFLSCVNCMDKECRSCVVEYDVAVLR